MWVVQIALRRPYTFVVLSFLIAIFGARAAAPEAAFTRLRPVLMTTLAMIIGTMPIAFALGGGGEQNAPLGRDVFGGLTVTTIATLFFVPTAFCVLHRHRQPVRQL